MGWTIGIPSLKLNNAGNKSKHCGDFQSVAEEALAERKGHDPDINPELSEKNIYEGFRTAKELMEYSEKHCNSLRDASGRKLRKDAVRMCVTVIKPPAMFMKAISRTYQIQFLNDSVECLEDIVGKENIKAKAYHFDEQGAHVHVFWEPMTKDGRLCAKEMHNLKFFGRINKEMPEFLRARGWDIDDCKAFDKAEFDAMTPEEQLAFMQTRQSMRGRSSKKYKQEMDAVKKVLSQEVKPELEEAERKIKEIKEELQVMENKKLEITELPEDRLGLVSWCMQHLKGVGDAIEDYCRKKYNEYVRQQETAKRKLIDEASKQTNDINDKISNAVAKVGKPTKPKKTKEQVR